MKTKYTVQHRRKREGKTDYRKRLELLKGRKDRVVIRRTNTQIIIQLVKYEEEGDKVLYTFKSSGLKKQGWNHQANNLPACYLAGLVAGKEMANKKVKSAILDLGLRSPKKGGKIYAALKGLVDSGLKIPVGDDIYPTEERIKGKHINEKVEKDFEKLKSKLEK